MTSTDSRDSDTSSAGRSHARSSADKAADLRDGYDDLRATLESRTDDLGGWIRRHPGRALLVGAVGGWILGLILGAGEDHSEDRS
ncbi:MAG: hypothetical protein AAGN46_03195 [Acidobacteriota bacterium]